MARDIGISRKEREIFRVVGLDAELSIGEVQKRTGYREHVVQHALQQLRKKNVLKSRPFIDGSRLGYTEYAVFFSIGSLNAKSRKALTAAFLRSKRVSWFAEFGGEYRFYAALQARSVGEVSAFLNDLAKKSGFDFLEKAVSVIVNYTIFNRKYFSDHSAKTESMTVGAASSSIELDALDHKILDGLMTQEYASRRQLAGQIKIPLSTLEYRIRKLEEDGVIKGFYSQTPSNAFGMQYCKLFLYVRGLDGAFDAQFAKFCAGASRVISFHRCFGSWDYEVGVDVSDYREAVEVSDLIFEAFGDQVLQVKIAPLLSEYLLESYAFGPA